MKGRFKSGSWVLKCVRLCRHAVGGHRSVARRLSVAECRNNRPAAKLGEIEVSKRIKVLPHGNAQSKNVFVIYN